MARVRVKDITTTATSPASDDFVMLDGTTSGTRKIDASNLGSDIPATPGTDGTYELNVASGTGTWAAVSTTTVAQGGTGATTAAGARTNLDVYSKGEADTAFSDVPDAPAQDSSDHFYSLKVSADPLEANIWAEPDPIDIPDVPDAPATDGSYELVVDGSDVSWVLGSNANDSNPRVPNAPAAPVDDTKYALEIDTDDTRTWVAIPDVAPLSAGGTNAENAADARTNLSVAEKDEHFIRALSSLEANAIHMNGVDDTIVIPNNALTNFGTTDFTIALVANIEERANACRVAGNMVSEEDGWAINMTNDGLITASINTAGTNLITTTTTNTFDVRGNTVHIVITVDRGGNLTRYVNGEAYGDALDISGRPGSIGNLNATRIGHAIDQSDEVELELHGRFYSFVVYREAINAERVRTLFEDANRPAINDGISLTTYEQNDSNTEGWTLHNVTATVFNPGTDPHVFFRETATNGFHYAERENVLEEGRSYEVTMEYWIVGLDREVQVTDGSAVLFQSETGGVSGWNTATFQFVATGTDFMIFSIELDGTRSFNSAGKSGLNIKNIIITESDVADISFQPGGITEEVWYDDSLNKLEASIDATLRFPSTDNKPEEQSKFDAVTAVRNGYSFIGASELNCAQNSNTDFGTGDFTVVALVKIPDTLDGTQTLFGTKGTSGAGWSINVNSIGQLAAAISDGTNEVTSTPDGRSLAGQIVHIAVSFDRDGNMTRYVHGRQYGTADSISLVSGSINNSSGLEMGHLNATNFFGGVIYRLDLWNRAQDASFVVGDYDAGEAPIDNDGYHATEGSAVAYEFDGANANPLPDWTATNLSDLRRISQTLRMAPNSTNGRHAAERTIGATDITTGARYRLTISGRRDSDHSSYDGFKLEGVANTGAFDLSGDGYNTYYVDFVASADRTLRIVLTNNGNDTFSGSGNARFDYIRITPTGPVVSFNGRQVTQSTWYDDSGNGVNAENAGASQLFDASSDAGGVTTPGMAYIQSSGALDTSTIAYNSSNRYGFWAFLNRDLVFFNFRFALTNRGTNTTDGIVLTGLPFRASNLVGEIFPVEISTHNLNTDATIRTVTAQIEAGEEFVRLFKLGTSGRENLLHDDISGTTQFAVSGTYRVDRT